MAEQDVFVPKWKRPVRIPPRVSLMHAEPGFVMASQPGRLRLAFRLAEDVREGEELKLQLFGGRNNKGGFMKARSDSPVDEEDIAVVAPGGERLPVRPDESNGTFFVTVPKGGLPAGALVHVELGGASGVRAPEGRMLNKFFVLHRSNPGGDPPTAWNADTQALIVGACTMHVLGGPTDHIHAYAPSQAAPREEIEILVRPEDRFSNLSHQPLVDVGAFLDGQELDVTAEPVPDSTCLRARVRLPAEGVHRVEVRDPRTGASAVANPTVCREARGQRGVYWGMIHGHTEMSDGTGTLDDYFRQARDEVALDFAAPGDHDHLWETSDAMWRLTCEKVKQWHEPGRFVTFLGYEWAKWRRNGDGDRNVYYLGDDRPLYRSDHGEYPTPPDLFRALRDETAIVIPHHTGHRGNFCDWKDHDPVHERLVEIYQVRGSYECSAEEGNTMPEHYPEPPFEGGYVRRALALGWRVGFTAGGDDHAGYAGTGRCRDGLMSVEAEGRTREAIWDALWHRRVVATTGPRMLLSWRLNGHPMGAELDAATEPSLSSRRTVRIEFHGTAPAREVAIIRNNEVVHVRNPGSLDCEFLWEDDVPLGDALIGPAKFCDHPFCFYYVRVTQADGAIAWASPIWIDAAPAP